MLFKSRRVQRRVLLVVALCAGAIGVVPAAAQASGSNLSLPKVMTRNLYLGADLTPALAALGCPDLGCTLAQNQIVWNQVVQTNFPERAKVLAKEIDKDDPYIVGLQEVALWRTGDMNFAKDACENMDPACVTYDFLAILLKELKKAGTNYKAIAVQQEADVESPAGTSLADAKDRRLTMRDVILVRTDLPKALVSFSNPQGGNYAAFISQTIPSGAYGGSIDFKRGWTSVDIKLLGHPAAKFVNTHLESLVSFYRATQAAELVAGPLNTSKPVILVGDLNSDPSIPLTDPAGGASDSWAYDTIAAAGFVGSGNTANTFGHNADVNEDPLNSVFDQRIDHVLTRPGFGHLTNKVVGRDPNNRTPGGLWPSDHAGLIVGIG